MIEVKSRRQNVPDISRVVGDSEIFPATASRILGVTVGASLSWEGHNSTVVQRCYCALLGLPRMKRRRPPDVNKLF